MVTPVAPFNATVDAMRTKIRRLTNSPDEYSLTTAEIDDKINTVYNQDFPYAIKIDQLRSVYTFFTQKNIDRYPLDINYNQGIRQPVYFEGVQGYFFKDRTQFYNMWPRWPTKNTFGSSVSGTITGITAVNPAVVTSANTLLVGDVVTFADVDGMTEINGLTGRVTVATATTFTVDIDASAFTPYTGGGTWSGTTRAMSFTIPQIPFLSTMVVMGGTAANGSAIKIVDGGNIGGNQTTGYLLQLTSDSVGDYVPSIPPTSPIPSSIPSNQIGTVDYVSGQVSLTLSSSPLLAGTELTVWVSQYTVGRPYSLLFWNNEFQVRPVPDDIYKIEVETYLTPVQFMQSNETPTLLQWWQYLAFLAARKILEERMDMDGVANLMPMIKEQEGLILERQGVEEIGQRNSTIFSGSTAGQQWGFPPGGWWG